MGLYKRIFARYYDAVMRSYERDMESRKRALLADVRGTVVEIGAGTGANLPYLAPGCRWIGVEPNEHMHDALRKRAREAGIEADIRHGGAEGIDVTDATADFAIGTLVLCSVPDPLQVLGELRRVLRPGGRFVFIEHVAAPRGTVLRGVQTAMQPLWRVWGDGCRVNRETGRLIEQSGFDRVRLDEFRAKVPPWVAPHISGEAIR